MDSKYPGKYNKLREFNQAFQHSADTQFMLQPQFTLPVPRPTSAYLAASDADCRERLGYAQPILLVLDLNGTLLYRADKRRPRQFVPRTDLDKFLKYIFNSANNFRVMIWTTAQPANAVAMRDKMLDRWTIDNLLVATWDRSKFGLNPHQYNEKTIIYKQLEWVWGDGNIQIFHPWRDRGYRWDQSNTILLDDSTVKATAQPYNHIMVPEFSGGDSDADVQHESVLVQVARYLDQVRVHKNVSGCMKVNPFKVDRTKYFMPPDPQPAVLKTIAQQVKHEELDPM
jgi:hypothetical protein